MDSQQEHHARQAPEVVGTTSYPEALAQNHYQQYLLGEPAAAKPEHSIVPGSHLSGTPYSTYGGSQFDHGGSPPSLYSRPAAGFGTEPGDGYGDGGKRRRRRSGGGSVLGCTPLVWALCVVIALLAAAVVGLAVATGVETHRAATATATGTSPAGDIDDDCSGNPEGVTGTTYKAFSVIGDYSFTIQCNADPQGDPLMSLFTADLNTCMDACAAWSRYHPASAGNGTGSGAACGAVSFIPSWTNKTAALHAGNGAPGNCYLKPAQTAAPAIPSGPEVHAGILEST